MRFAAVLAVPLLALVAAAPVAPAPAKTRPALEAVLARLRESGGNASRYHIVGEEHTSDGSTLRNEMQGARYRIRRCVGELCSGTYFDGSSSFETDINDTALPSDAAPQALRVALDAIETNAFTAPEFLAAGGRVAFASDAPSASTDLVVVAPNAPPLLVRLDPASSLVQSARTLDARFVFEFADRRDVGGGAMLPFRIDMNGAPFETFLRRAIDPSPLSEPVGLVPSIEGGSAVLPLLRGTLNATVPVVACTIGGIETACLIDTGNSGLSMSLELSERLSIEPVSGAFGIRGVGSYVTGVVKAPPLDLGGAHFPGAYYAVLHDIHRYGWDVVLGTDAFAHARVTVDYPERRLVLEPAGAPAAAKADALPIAFHQFVPVVDVRIADAEVPLMLDTGDESAINLAYAYYETHPGIFKPTSKSKLAGVGGISDAISGELPRAQIGPYLIERAPVAATRRIAPIAQGHAGSGLFTRFRLTLDYAHGRIELQPRAGDRSVRRI